MNAPPLNQFLDLAFAWIWQTSLAATVLIALVLLVQLVFKHSLAPRWRYALGLLVLLRLAMPVVPSSPVSIFNLGKQFESKPVAPASMAPAPVTIQPPVSVVPLPDLPVVTANIAPAIPGPRISLYTVVKYVWLAGCLGMLAIVAWQYRRFTLKLRSWGEIGDPRALVLLKESKAALGVKRRVRLMAATEMNTPALFGLRRPCLIIPGEMLGRLDDRELRHILLHELIHLQRGDLLVNWAMILLRAAHWFNPVVWLAFRRLRADQELACDAAVLSRLAGDERRAYGDTLIRLLDDFSAAGLCPGLVPFFTSKQVIKRRIVMIANFKPAGRIALLASVALIVALGGLTFTRAAGNSAGSTDQTGQSPTPSADLQRAVADFQKVLADFDQRVREQEMKVNELRLALRVVDTDPNSSGPGSSLGPLSVMALNSQKITAETEAAGEEKTQAELKKLRENPDRFRDTLNRIYPDPILTSLIQQLLTADNTLVSLKTSLSSDHPDVVRAKAVRDDLDLKIKSQVEAIMQATETKLAALKARASWAQEKLQEAKSMDLEAASAQRPYWEAKAELDRVKRLRDVIATRAFQERVEAQMLQNGYSAQGSKDDVPNVPPDVMKNYQIASENLARAWENYRNLLNQYPADSPSAQAQSSKIGELQKVKTRIESMYPQLQSAYVPPDALLFASILSDGSIHFGADNKPVTVEQLKAVLKESAAKNAQTRLWIKADQHAPFESMVKVMDAAKEANIRSVTATTSNE